MSDGDLLSRFNLLVAALRDRSLSPAAQTVLGEILAHFNGQTGQCSPSFDRLAATSGLARRSVVRAVRELREAGWIEREHATREGGQSFLSNSFRPAFGRASPTPEVGTKWSPPPRDEMVSTGRDEMVPRVGTKRGLEVGTKRSPKHRKRNTGRGTLCADVAPEEFEAWWMHYPRKVAKDAARKAFDRVRKESRATVDELIAGAQRYASERVNEDPRFTAHAATWLNAGRWADEAGPRRSRPNGSFSALDSLRETFRHDDE